MPGDTAGPVYNDWALLFARADVISARARDERTRADEIGDSQQKETNNGYSVRIQIVSHLPG
jgi:hypothetical protein